MLFLLLPLIFTFTNAQGSSCTNNVDCFDPVYSRCSGGYCQSCSSNADCSQFPGFCTVEIGCVECISSTNCMNPEKSYCNPDVFACDVCNSNTACSQFSTTRTCAIGVGCVECTDSGQCTTTAKPYCNENMNVCEICHTDSDCTKFEKVCSSTLGCVECIDSTQCTTTTNPYCDIGRGVCAACRNNNDCAKFANAQYCDTSAGTCKLYESLSSEELQQVETLSTVGNATGVTATVAIMLANILSPGDSGGASGGILAKILQYIKYINIQYSPRLDAMFKSYHSSPGSLSFLAPKLSDSVIQAFSYQEVPSTFVEYNVNSSFIVNFWSSLISSLILSAVFIIIRGAEWACRKRSPKDILRIRSRQIRIAAQNFLILQFYNMYCDIVLFFSVEITRTGWNSIYPVLSYFTSLTFMILGIALLSVHFMILYQYQTLQKKGRKGKPNQELELYVLKTEGFKAFFKNFKDDSFARQAFLLVFTVRSCLSNFIIVFLYEHPLAQAALITSMTVIIFIYLLIMRPFKLIVNLSQQITYEALFLISNICLLILAVLDNLESSSINLRENLCNVIVIVSLVFGFIPNLFVFAKIVSTALTFYRLRKSKLKKSEEVKSNLNCNIRNARSDMPHLDLHGQQNAGMNQINHTSHGVQNQINILDMNLPRPESLKQDIGIYQPSSTLQLKGGQSGIQSLQRRLKIQSFIKQSTPSDKIESYNNHINLDNSEMKQNENSISFINSSTLHMLNDESGFDNQRIISQAQIRAQINIESPRRRNISD